MVALDSVETAVKKLYPEFMHAVIAIPSDKKGEEILLITTNKDAKSEEIVSYYKDNGLPEIALPRTIEVVEEIPLLGTGKTDYVTIKKKYSR
ncbi:MAG: Bifunctional protein Aas [Alphaproteobacteria bacterium ADurb.Bin438]|nr:MAG: Bifunctional protein Aas [Alphaproteobacteria bacterium ADurb.Bin438]